MKQLSQRLLGPVTLVSLALTLWLGVWVTPRDRVQGDLARLVYVHPAIAWVALYLSFGTATIASALYLWQRTRSMTMDRIAHCAMEVSLFFIALAYICHR
jgi:heme exporter protein C